MNLIIRPLDTADIDTELLDNILEDMGKHFPQDEIRPSQDCHFVDSSGERYVRGLETLVRYPKGNYSTAHFLAGFEEGNERSIDGFRGAILAHLFPNPKMVFWEYSWIRSGHRGNGNYLKLTSYLIDKIALPNNVLGIFSEADKEDEAKDNADRDLRVKRLKLFEGIGKFVLDKVKYEPANYVGGGKPVPMHPLFWNLTKDNLPLSTKHFLDFMKLAFRDVYGFTTNNNRHIKLLEDSMKGTEIMRIRPPLYTDKPGNYGIFLE